MIPLIDILCGVGAVYFLVLLWVRVASNRLLFMGFAAFVVVVLGIVGTLHGRWQVLPLALLVPVLFGALLLMRRRAPVADWLATLGAGIATLLVPLAAVPIWVLPILDLPPPSGPHAVGVREFELVDSAREGVLDLAPGTPRRLLARVWYPAVAAGPDAPRRYATAAEAATTFTSLAGTVRLPGFFFRHLQHVGTHSYVDAPVLEGATLPVLQFSHGYGSYLAQNTVLMEDLASHGYVVFSLAHPLDAAAVLFADGSVIEPGAGWFAAMADATVDLPESERMHYAGADYDERFEGFVRSTAEQREDDTRIHRSAWVWLADRQFLAAALRQGRVPMPVREILAHADLSRVGHMGMSFGGSTAAALCALESTCAAVINLDGGDYHETMIDSAPTAPLLMLHSDMENFAEFVGADPEAGDLFAFNDFSYERYAQAGDESDVTRLWVREVQHIGISDYPILLRQPLRGLLAGDIDGERMMNLLNATVRAFFDLHLRGADSGFPDAQLTAFEPSLVEHRASAVRRWWLTKSATERDALRTQWRVAAGRSTMERIGMDAASAPAAIQGAAGVEGGASER